MVGNGLLPVGRQPAAVPASATVRTRIRLPRCGCTGWPADRRRPVSAHPVPGVAHERQVVVVDVLPVLVVDLHRALVRVRSGKIVGRGASTSSSGWPTVAGWPSSPGTGTSSGYRSGGDPDDDPHASSGSGWRSVVT